LRPYTRAERLVIDGSGEVIGLVLHELPAALHASCEAMASAVQYAGGMSPPANRGLQRLLQALERRAVRRLVRARQGVVLAMGGFVFDPELMRRSAPAYAGCSLRLGTAGDDGTGIRMGQAVGGAVGQMDRCTAPRFIDPPTEWWGGILVGPSGRRICNETYYGGKIGEHLIERHGGRGTLVLDATTMAAGRRQVFRGHLHAYQRIFGVVNGWVAARSAPTLRALAGSMGIDADALEQTVAEYNRGVEQGRDALGKAPEHLAPIERPPYWGIPLDYDSRLFPTPCLTLGGLRTDGPTSRVLTDDGTPIDGLYAAGRTAVGVASNGYASGLSISDGLFAGRNAGRHASARTPRA
ncbi:MAG: FAD-binding protein, partial [Myxococcales bacterium]|nr:FAD-binding protein [Myxococcales bacterium]